jgi:drug/metabolite transporter (DMT)-like permease
LKMPQRDVRTHPIIWIILTLAGVLILVTAGNADSYGLRTAIYTVGALVALAAIVMFILSLNFRRKR